MTTEPSNPRVEPGPGPVDQGEIDGRSWRQKPRRLGTLEYMLLALVVLCVAVTVVMALVNPGG